MRYRRLTPIGYAARRCDPVPMECEDLLHMRTDFSHGREVFERRSRSDCVHEQIAKRIANVRFIADREAAAFMSKYRSGLTMSALLEEQGGA